MVTPSRLQRLPKGRRRFILCSVPTRETDAHRETNVRIVRSLDVGTLNLERSILSIGNFDGFHRGHQQLLAQGALFAENERAPLVVLTFDPHPIAILRPDQAPARLATQSDKLEALRRHGVDVAIVLESSPELLGMEPDRFIEVVVEAVHPVHVVEGSTFGFGRQRRGTPELLGVLGDRFGFKVCVIEPVRLQIDEHPKVAVSSSLIRKLVSAGKVYRAALCLGHPYSLTGCVLTGVGRGATLGFPTANVADIRQLVPADGVYGGLATVRGCSTPAAISIGTNPTFDGSERKVEAHLLDFDQNVTDEPIRLNFDFWLRKQRKFADGDDLARQIAADVATIRARTASGA